MEIIYKNNKMGFYLLQACSFLFPKKVCKDNRGQLAVQVLLVPRVSLEQQDGLVHKVSLVLLETLVHKDLKDSQDGLDLKVKAVQMVILDPQVPRVEQEQLAVSGHKVPRVGPALLADRGQQEERVSRDLKAEQEVLVSLVLRVKQEQQVIQVQ